MRCSQLARRFHFYNVYITLNGNATRIHFTDFLDRVRNIDWPDRIRRINFHPTALFGLNVPTQDNLTRIVSVGKYRQSIKPYIGDINSDQANMIQNDVIEMVTFVAIPVARTILLEFNFYGSKIKELEMYFNSFFPTNDQRNQWAIVFDPISSNKSLADVRQSNDIRELSLKMNVETNAFDQLFQRSQQTTVTRNSLFGKLMSTTNAIKEQTDSPVVEISFGKGRKRNLDLNSHEILALIDVLDVNNNDSIQSCKVTYKNIVTGKNETLELKNVGVLSDSILENDNANHAWEFLGDKILERYIATNRPRSNEFVTKRIRFIDAEMPTLVAAPQAIHAVPVQAGARREA